MELFVLMRRYGLQLDFADVMGRSSRQWMMGQTQTIHDTEHKIQA
jgi:hypothetical protein